MNIPKNSPLTQDKVIFWSFLVSILLLITTIVLLAINFRLLPPFLPIYNKLPWGYTRLGNTWEMLLPLGIALIFSSINITITAKLHIQNPLLARLLSVTTTFICLFICIFTIKIISVII